MCVHRQKIKVYFKYWFCLHCTFVHISVNKKSLLIKHFSGVERWSYIEMLWEGSEFDLKSWFSMAILNTTIHNKLRLYIKENQNMVYVVLGFFLLFVTFSWCIICSFPQNVWKQQMLKFFLNHKGTLFEEHTLWHQCLALFAWIGLKEETSNTPTMLHVFPETDNVNVSPWLLLTYDV